jgi:beta-glucosidase
LLRRVAEVNPALVTVVFSGRPLLLDDAAEVSQAILLAGHSGTMTACAAASILFGDRNPCGKLAMTYPRSVGQLPIYYNHRAAGRDIDMYYGPTEFRNYQDGDGSPMYPFGYGLQYTAYRYGDIEVEPELPRAVHIHVQVHNDGSRAGIETVQCYISAPASGFVRPVRELKGFRTIKLEPGESGTVTFSIAREDLAHITADGRSAIPAGRYRAWIGSNCIDTQMIEFDM